MTNNQEKLLPCPFCGSSHVYITNPEYYGCDYNHDNYEAVECGECYAASGMVSDKIQPRELKIQAIIKQWNTRAPSKLEELRDWIESELVEIRIKLDDAPRLSHYAALLDGASSGLENVLEKIKEMENE